MTLEARETTRRAATEILAVFTATLLAPGLAIAQDPVSEAAHANAAIQSPAGEPIIPLPTGEVDCGAYISGLSLDELSEFLRECARGREVYATRAESGLGWMTDHGVPSVHDHMERIREDYAQLSGQDVESAGYTWRRIASEYDYMALKTPKRLPARAIYERAGMQAMEAALFAPGGTDYRPCAQSAASGFAALLERLEEGETYVGVVTNRTYTWKDALEFCYAVCDIIAASEQEGRPTEYLVRFVKDTPERIRKMLVRLGRESECEYVMQDLMDRYAGTKLQEQLGQCAVAASR
ncbi:MAG TPA: hypothetical protein PLO37_03980 [Candidatus Hydrogenedentes bacterium]|nr:hypothetical protein [Candidatus Hydrogenedentota bacterium]HPG65982.1 hypothetical protein [Candidatus Hydrogenedentota bacterium]